ncbi:hypothetical protein E2562_035022 [Oryza meyeriana var. granulata]|uniref:Uncharacterized protein n=1 Tax=Oryza meyeriana var. granulata TaxID=110450 RepID=A0A6G1F1Q6_9ORYZ|nr:hypothetical protein E2562_035022 [Oryza meyeriana var. granulata]
MTARSLLGPRRRGHSRPRFYPEARASNPSLGRRPRTRSWSILVLGSRPRTQDPRPQSRVSPPGPEARSLRPRR